MRLWIMSDLHVDGKGRDFDLLDPPRGADVLVVAGDIADGFEKGIKWIERQRQRGIDIPILWIPGNHDFYGSIDPDGDRAAAKAKCIPLSVNVLGEGETIFDRGVRCIGATLWTDFAAVSSDPVDIATAQVWAKHAMPDYKNIDIGMKRLLPRDTLHWHRFQKLAIERTLREPLTGPTVVVTHHAPHRRSLDDPAFPDPSDGSFASDLGDLMDRYQPELWIHGHLHWGRDYRVGGTRVVCNPRGYDGEHGFDEKYVIEVTS